jgi:enamine deaminase RidA (YjgF/YER057c/UK114 family)
VFIAGQTPSDAQYEPVAVGDLRAQYLHVMDALSLQLEAAGATWADVVFRRIYVLDMDGFLAMQRDPSLPQPWPPNLPPPSTLIGVTRLSHPDFGLEIDLLAVTQS